LIEKHAARGGLPDLVSRIIGEDIEEYLDADQRAHRVERDLEAERGLKAMALAPRIGTCRALLRGERVPWHHLDLQQAERHGLRDGARRPDGRYGLDDFNDARR
jgi:hypothetical protein